MCLYILHWHSYWIKIGFEKWHQFRDRFWMQNAPMCVCVCLFVSLLDGNQFHAIAFKWKWCMNKMRYYKLRIWTKVIMLAHPFKYLDFVVWVCMCLLLCFENRWLLKLIVSSAILSVLKVLVCVCVCRVDEKSQQMRSFFSIMTKAILNEVN